MHFFVPDDMPSSAFNDQGSRKKVLLLITGLTIHWSMPQARRDGLYFLSTFGVSFTAILAVTGKTSYIIKREIVTACLSCSMSPSDIYVVITNFALAHHRHFQDLSLICVMQNISCISKFVQSKLHLHLPLPGRMHSHRRL